MRPADERWEHTLLAALLTVFENWEGVFQNMLEPSLKPAIQRVFGTLNRWIDEPTSTLPAAEVNACLENVETLLTGLSLHSAAEQVGALCAEDELAETSKVVADVDTNEMFELLDTNHDGVLDREEWAAAQAADVEAAVSEGSHVKAFPVLRTELEGPLAQHTFFVEEVSQTYFANEYFDARERLGRYYSGSSVVCSNVRVYRVINETVEAKFGAFRHRRTQTQARTCLLFYCNTDEILNSRMQDGFPGPRDVTQRSQRITLSTLADPPSLGDASEPQTREARFVLCEVAQGRSLELTPDQLGSVSLHGALPYFDSIRVLHDGAQSRRHEPYEELIPLHQDQVIVRYLLEFDLSTSTPPRPLQVAKSPPSRSMDGPGGFLGSGSPAESRSPGALSGDLYELENCLSDADPDAFALVMYALGKEALGTVAAIHRIHNQVMEERFQLRKSELILPLEASKFLLCVHNTDALSKIMSRGFWLPSPKKGGGIPSLMEQGLILHERTKHGIDFALERREMRAQCSFLSARQL